MRKAAVGALAIGFVLSRNCEAATNSVPEPSRLSAVRMATGPLSPDAESMVGCLSLQPWIDKLDEARTRFRTCPAATLESLTGRQDMLEARQEILRLLTKANLEVDYVLSAIDGEQNRFSKF